MRLLMVFIAIFIELYYYLMYRVNHKTFVTVLQIINILFYCLCYNILNVLTVLKNKQKIYI